MWGEFSDPRQGIRTPAPGWPLWAYRGSWFNPKSPSPQGHAYIVDSEIQTVKGGRKPFGVGIWWVALTPGRPQGGPTWGWRTHPLTRMESGVRGRPLRPNSFE